MTSAEISEALLPRILYFLTYILSNIMIIEKMSFESVNSTIHRKRQILTFNRVQHLFSIFSSKF